MSGHQNIMRLRAVADALGELLPIVVFVGGATINLYSTRAATPEVRYTDDVDCIVELASYAAYARMEEKLREKGFKHLPESAVQVRWQVQGIIVDIMPADPAILGFTNRWYGSGLQHTFDYLLLGSRKIRLLQAPYFLATKLEAFHNRGEDPRWDSDFEDIIFLLDHRPELLKEIRASADDVKKYLQEEMRKLIAYPHLSEAVEAVMDSGANPASIVQRIVDIGREG